MKVYQPENQEGFEISVAARIVEPPVGRALGTVQLFVQVGPRGAKHREIGAEALERHPGVHEFLWTEPEMKQMRLVVEP